MIGIGLSEYSIPEDYYGASNEARPFILSNIFYFQLKWWVSGHCCIVPSCLLFRGVAVLWMCLI